MPFRTDSDQAHGGGYRSEADKPADTGIIDYAKSLGSGALEGLAATVDQLHHQLTSVPVLGAADHAANMVVQAATGRPHTSALEASRPLGSDYQPQTTPGRYLHSVGEFAPGALFPGSALTRIAGAVLPGVASEGTGDIARSMGASPELTKKAQMVAALAGGAATGLTHMPNTADRMLAEAVPRKSVPDAKIDEAAQLMSRGLKLPNGGVRLTGDEAIAMVTGGGTGIQRLSRGVVNTRKGGNRMAQALRDRPDQVRNATMGTLDQIAPPVQNPAAVGLRGQAAAEGAVGEVKQARSAAVNPDYTAAGPQTVDPAGMKSLLSDIDAAVSADKTGLIGGRLQQLRDLLAASPDVENIDRVRKFFRDRSELPVGSTDALTGEESKAINGFLQRLSNEGGSGLLDAVPEFASGKAKYQALSKSLVEPVTSGPVGRIATEATDLRADPVQQGTRLYPSNPPEGAANETVAALRSLNSVDPTIGADLTRLHLTNRFNETAQDLQGGPNPAGGAKFAADIAANREQEANLMAGIGEAAPKAAPDMKTLIETLRATGMRGNEGSPTAGYQAFAKDLGVGEAPVELAKTIARPLGVPARIGTWLENRALEKNSDKLLDVLLADPEQFKAMMLKARASGANGKMVADLLRGFPSY
jgi:hypothetical protein